MIPILREKVHGVIVVDGREVARTLSCAHCGIHWEVKPGSGIKRGFCQDCKAPLCGKKECMVVCTPMGARLDLSDALQEQNMREAKRIIEKYPNIKII